MANNYCFRNTHAGPKFHTQVEMAKKRNNEDIEEAITAAFSQLGYPVVKAEQLEAAREFVKGQDVFVSGSGKSLCYG